MTYQVVPQLQIRHQNLWWSSPLKAALDLMVTKMMRYLSQSQQDLLPVFQHQPLRWSSLKDVQNLRVAWLMHHHCQWHQNPRWTFHCHPLWWSRSRAVLGLRMTKTLDQFPLEQERSLFLKLRRQLPSSASLKVALELRAARTIRRHCFQSLLNPPSTLFR